MLGAHSLIFHCVLKPVRSPTLGRVHPHPPCPVPHAPSPVPHSPHPVPHALYCVLARRISQPEWEVHAAKGHTFLNLLSPAVPSGWHALTQGGQVTWNKLGR